MKKKFTVLLLTGAISLPAFSHAEEPLPYLKKVPSPQVKTVYEIKQEPTFKRTEFPIEMGTISGKIFEETTVLDEGNEKIKYIQKPIEPKIAEKTVPAKLKQIKPVKVPVPQEVKIAKAKVDYPKGTIILLDNTIIKPTQKTIKIASANISKKTPKIKTTKTVSSKKPKHKNTIKVPKIRITYLADESEIASNTRKKLLQFIRKLRNKNGGKVKIITSYTPVPFQEEQTLAESRVKYVKAFMREQGVNPEKYNFSSTHKKSGKSQYLEMEFIS